MNSQNNKCKHFLTQDYEQLSTYFDPVYQALWCIMKPPKPVFTLTLLQNIRSAQDRVAELCNSKKEYSPKYIIWLSDNPNCFSLGLDIHYILQLIAQEERENLSKYLDFCMDVFYINLLRLDIKPSITISLIRGKAYGAGLEAAISNDVVFVEEGTKCCFPEIRYNLLPSVGTLKMLMRKIPHSELKDSIFKGKQLSIDLLRKEGLIEKIVPASEVNQVIHNYLKRIHPRHRIFSYLYREKSKALMLSPKELLEFKQLWLDAALSLDYNDIKKLKRLATGLDNFASKPKMDCNTNSDTILPLVQDGNF